VLGCFLGLADQVMRQTPTVKNQPGRIKPVQFADLFKTWLKMV